jgi:hypothetical protein
MTRPQSALTAGEIVRARRTFTAAVSLLRWMFALTVASPQPWQCEHQFASRCAVFPGPDYVDIRVCFLGKVNAWNF